MHIVILAAAGRGVGGGPSPHVQNNEPGAVGAAAAADANVFCDT